MSDHVVDRVAFRAGDIADDLSVRLPDGISDGLIARRDLRRYYALLGSTLDREVTLSRGEALACCEAIEASFAGGVLLSPDAMVTVLLDRVRFDGQVPGLGAKVLGWEPVQRVAVLDAVERWVVLTERGVDPDEALVLAGLWQETENIHEHAA